MKLKITIVLLFACLCNGLFAQNWNSNKVSQRLQTAIQEHPANFHKVSILLTEQADIESLDQTFRQQKAPRHTRAKAVVSNLKATAQTTQLPFITFLNQSEGVISASIQPYWVVNVIFADVKKEVIETLSNDNRIALIDINAKLELDEYEDVPSETLETIVTPNGTETGLRAINAPAMWALGYTGYNTKVLSIDTGVDPTHPALSQRFYGNFAGNDLAWFDYTNPNSLPNDCGDHGTHTIGTMVGLDPTNNDTIGVAYKALFMVAQAICSGGLAGDNIASFQWAMDPDGNANTTSDMPDVINNSWQDPSASFTQCTGMYVPLFINLEAAGIAVVFSAGNAGPSASTITPPKNINIDTVNVFCVAAVNGNNPAYPIAGFSSIGPSICGGTGSLLIKPEVSAPGQSVRSCEPNNTYGTKSGTSMAAPHVSGALLLLKQAFPNLHSRDLKMSLYQSAVDLGPVGEDNTFGMGMIDVLAAYNWLINQGNQPAPPYANNDLGLEGITNINNVICGTSFSPVLQVFNQGSDTVYNAVFQLEYENGTIDSMLWSGVVAPFEQFSVAYPTQSPGTGYFRLKFKVASVNGIVDERSNNNLIAIQFLMTDQEPVTGTDGSACVESSVLLQATHASNTGEIQWYNSLNSQNALATGSAFLAPSIDNNSTAVTYYADIVNKDSVGLVDNSLGSGFYTNDLDNYLEFNAFSDFTLKSLTVYTDVLGARKIEVINAVGSTVASKVVSLAILGENKVDLNFFIPAGQNYKIKASIRAEYYANVSGHNFPYVVSEIAEITGSGPALGQAYYYFYNWEVEYGSPCGRVPVIATADTGSHVTNFMLLADTVNQFAIMDIPFTDSTIGATSWAWNFGDGATSTDQNPTHHYDQSGTYHVILSTTGTDGCADALQKTIVVENAHPVTTETSFNDLATIRVFPNPSAGDFTVDFDLETQRIVKGQVFDLLGRAVLIVPTTAVQNNQIQLNANTLDKGIYILRLEVGDKIVVRKLMKL